MGGLVGAIWSDEPDAQVLDDDQEGRVVQWRWGDLLVLISGLRPRCSPGEPVPCRVVLNNQGPMPLSVRVGALLSAPGGSPVASASANTGTVAPYDATHLDLRLDLPPGLPAGDYLFQLEVGPVREPPMAVAGAGKLRVRMAVV